MDKRIIDIAKKLLMEHTRHEQLTNVISIFLCGGSSEKEKELRKNIRKRLASLTSKYSYRVHFPEDMFIDLILGHQKSDLLSLENLLATSVNVVVILLNSPGTLAELGAFTNYVGLKDKLVVAINPQYKRARSFINLGPVRFLLENTKSKIIWSAIEIENIDVLTGHIAEESRQVSKLSQPHAGLLSPIWAYDYIISLIFVLEPITKSDLLYILKIIHNDDNTWETCAQSSSAVLSSLINERKISANSDILITTIKGNKNLISLDPTKRKIRKRLEFLSQLRMEALNVIFRKKNANKWGKRVAA